MLYTVTAATLLFILAPLLVTISLSVSELFVSFPPKGFTLPWYGKVLADPDFRSCPGFSLGLAALRHRRMRCCSACRPPSR